MRTSMLAVALLGCVAFASAAHICQIPINDNSDRSQGIIRSAPRDPTQPSNVIINHVLNYGDHSGRGKPQPKPETPWGTWNMFTSFDVPTLPAAVEGARLVFFDLLDRNANPADYCKSDSCFSLDITTPHFGANPRLEQDDLNDDSDVMFDTFSSVSRTGGGEGDRQYTYELDASGVSYIDANQGSTLMFRFRVHGDDSLLRNGLRDLLRFHTWDASDPAKVPYLELELPDGSVCP
eukprot:CAMPEP_0197442832 /NCGR_PEP_ID=MMETSP1175-20131217/8755_1 /TAXON_ID=1003142 /ORGANISM="Triceratium dubium, Strain CCMP147" /LENGTH=235 /DNA_ID=CAMNT_0042973379 /DNA_START=115 /DNA_END=822 /DNA_ORIENTATION=-